MTEVEKTVAIRQAFTERYGSCAIEAGLIGNLADNECEHGNLPTDEKPACECFTAPERKR